VVRYRVVIRIRKVLGKGIVNSMHASEANEQPGDHSARCEAFVQKIFERPSRERVSGEGGHRGGSHVSVHITSIPQGRNLGAQSSVIVRVVAKCVVRA